MTGHRLMQIAGREAYVLRRKCDGVSAKIQGHAEAQSGLLVNPDTVVPENNRTNHAPGCPQLCGPSKLLRQES